MKFRIISGEFKGRILYTPDRGKSFRPTLERTRESVCEIIKPKLQNAVTADICSGSGALGFEMLSRGASRADFVEKDRSRLDYLKKNAKILGVTDRCRFYNQDVNRFINNKDSCYDIIYYDPPYDLCKLKDLIFDISFLLSTNGILIYEHSLDYKSKDIFSDIEFKPYDIRYYGNTVIDFYKRSARL